MQAVGRNGGQRRFHPRSRPQVILPSGRRWVTIAASAEDSPTPSGTSSPRSTARRCSRCRVRHPRRHPQPLAMGRTWVVRRAAAHSGDGSPLYRGHPGRRRDRAFRTRHPSAPGWARLGRAATALMVVCRSVKPSAGLDPSTPHRPRARNPLLPPRPRRPPDRSRAEQSNRPVCGLTRRGCGGMTNRR
jgi:hypothetical protein